MYVDHEVHTCIIALAQIGLEIPANCIIGIIRTNTALIIRAATGLYKYSICATGNSIWGMRFLLMIAITFCI